VPEPLHGVHDHWLFLVSSHSRHRAEFVEHLQWVGGRRGSAAPRGANYSPIRIVTPFGAFAPPPRNIDAKPR
jgi:hypothetical protein